MSDRPVGIVGAGSWGTALAMLVAAAGRPALLWAREPEQAERLNRERVNARYLPEAPFPDGLEATSDLSAVAGRCGLVLMAVPSGYLEETARALGGAGLDGRHMLVSCIKGFADDHLTRMTEVLRRVTPVRQIGALSGPNLAGEIALGQPAATVVASRYPAVVAAAQAALSGPRFRVYGNADVVGTELGGALKNALALAAGAGAGLGHGDNTRALLLTRGLAEMVRVGERLGALPTTFAGLSGIGDLMATAFSPLSRNYQVGYRLAKGESLEAVTASMQQVAEGVKTARRVAAFARGEGLSLPIFEGLATVTDGGASPQHVIDRLLLEPGGRE